MGHLSCCASNSPHVIITGSTCVKSKPESEQYVANPYFDKKLQDLTAQVRDIRLAIKSLEECLKLTNQRPENGRDDSQNRKCTNPESENVIESNSSEASIDEVMVDLTDQDLNF